MLHLNKAYRLGIHCMLHLLLHTVTGAIIDRYAIPAFISTYLAIIILIFYFIPSDKYNIRINGRKKQKYNSSSNISKF